MKKQRKAGVWLIVVSMLMTLLFSSCVFAEQEIASGADGLTIRVTGTADGDAFSDIAPMLDAGSLNIRVGQDADGGLLNVGVDVAGQELFSALLKITDEKVAFQIPQMGDSVYELPYDTVMELVENLVSGTGTSDSAPVDLTAFVPQISEELIGEALNPVLEAIAQPLLEIMQVSTEQDVELTSLGETVQNCTVYTFQPSAQQTEALLNNLADAISPNEALDELEAQITDYIRSLQGILTTTGSAAGTEEMDAEETADMIDATYAQLPDLIHENAQMIGEALEQAEAQITVAVTSEGIPALIELDLSDAGSQSEIRAASELLIADTGAQFYLGMAVDDTEMAVKGAVSVEGTDLTGSLDIYTPDAGNVVSAWMDFDLTSSSLFGVPYGEIRVASGKSGFLLNIGEGPEGWVDRISISLSSEDGLVEASDGSGEEDVISSNLDLWIDINQENTAAAPEGTTVDLSTYTPEQFAELFGAFGGSVE